MLPDFNALGKGFDKLLELLERIAVALERIHADYHTGRASDHDW